MHTSIAPCNISIDSVRENIVGVERQVPLHDGQMVTYINFDNGASTPMLRPVLDKVNEFMEWYSSIHRGSGFKSQLSSLMHDQCREIVARFVNVDPESHAIIFVKNATEAMNKLARRIAVKKDDIILVSKMEHHSNDLPWRTRAKVVYVELDERGKLDKADLQAKLEQYKGRIALFAVSGASNVTGWVNDVHDLARLCHSYGVKIAVDAAQWIPHRKIDMCPVDEECHIDYLSFSAHKIYAPLGIGVLIGLKEDFHEGDPDIVGGGTVDVVSLDYAYWTAVPEKEEAGSPNTVGIVALAKALAVLEEIGMDECAAHEARLTTYCLERLTKIPGVTIYGGSDPYDVENRMGVISFNIRGVPNALTAAILNYEAGIGVRNGCFCAQPYMKHMLQCSDEDQQVMEKKIITKNKHDLPGAVRASFGIYNTEAEIDLFLEMVQKIVDRKWEAEYEEDTLLGEFHLKQYAPEFDEYFKL